MTCCACHPPPSPPEPVSALPSSCRFARFAASADCTSSNAFCPGLEAPSGSILLPDDAEPPPANSRLHRRDQTDCDATGAPGLTTKPPCQRRPAFHIPVTDHGDRVAPPRHASHPDRLSGLRTLKIGFKTHSARLRLSSMPPYLKCSGTACSSSPQHPAARALQIKTTGLSAEDGC